MGEVSWEAAIEDFLNGVMGNHEESTERFYRVQLRQLQFWCKERAITMTAFTAADMRRYLAHRADPVHEDVAPCPGCRAKKGKKHAADCPDVHRVSDTTRRHDAIAARVFFRFCKREGHLDVNVLHDYKLPSAEKGHVRMPSKEDLEKLLCAVVNKWDVRSNRKIRFVGLHERQFWRHRDYAIICTLVETGMRIGECLALKTSDYRKDKKVLTVTHAKGNVSRDIPITDSLIAPLDAWLKVRPQCGTEAMFVTQFGEGIDAGTWSKTFRRYLEFAGLERFTRHGIRHFVATNLTNCNVATAQSILGHKDAKTTLGYYHPNSEQIRNDHASVAPLGKILHHKSESEPKRRRKVI